MAYTLPTAASSTVEYEDFYESTLAQPLGVSDTDIYPVNMPASAVGFLVIDANGTTPEIVFYNTKGASYVRCPSATDGEGRGVFQTTPRPYEAGTKIGMYSIAAFFEGIVTGRFMRDEFLQARHFSSTLNVGQWAGIGSACIAVTNEGNRSSTLTFASSVASKVSPGMRLLLEKTVPGNAYMGGAFNGTNHYYTKVSPTGTLATVTNNFSIERAVRLTSYGSIQNLCGRGDSTPANGFWLRVEPSGQVSLGVFNGGGANYRYTSTHQSLPLQKTVVVTASWATGAVVIYFDGIAVPLQAVITSGTAPTTAGTGGDFSIGRLGAYNGQYSSDYASNCAVFDKVLTPAEVKQYSTYKLTGAEPNCIGAWSLDNTAVNQQNPGTNDLTAMNGVSYTAMSPHGQLGNGVEPSKAIALVMAVNGSTVTVQTPEGVTIPTTGGISAVSYAASGVPFGWVTDDARWAIETIHKTLINTGVVGLSVITNLGGLNIYVPSKGAWKEIGFDVQGQITHAGAPWLSQQISLSTSNSSISDRDLVAQSPSLSATLSEQDVRQSRRKPITTTAATTYYLLTASNVVASTTQYFSGGDTFGCSGTNRIWAIPAGI